MDVVFVKMISEYNFYSKLSCILKEFSVRSFSWFAVCLFFSIKLCRFCLLHYRVLCTFEWIIYIKKI